MKDATKEALNLSSNGDSNDEKNQPHKILLSNTQLSRVCTAYAIGSSAYIKLSKTQVHRIGQSQRFLDRLSGPLLKSWLPLMISVLKSLAKSIVIPLRLTASASAADAAFQAFQQIWHNNINNFE